VVSVVCKNVERAIYISKDKQRNLLIRKRCSMLLRLPVLDSTALGKQQPHCPFAPPPQQIYTHNPFPTHPPNQAPPTSHTACPFGHHGPGSGFCDGGGDGRILDSRGATCVWTGADKIVSLA
jgi:hypothetical protein